MVSAIVQGQEVHGKIHLRESDAILLEITHPYRGILTGTSLPKFFEQEKDLNGDYGDYCIRLMLKQLLAIGDYTHSHLLYLIPHYLKLKADIENIYYESIAEEVYLDKVFFKKTLFFFKHFPKLHVSHASWQGILDMICNEIGDEGILCRTYSEEIFEERFKEVVLMRKGEDRPKNWRRNR